MKRYVLAIEVGGTKVEVAVVNEAADIIVDNRQPVDVNHGPKGFLNQLIELSAPMLQDHLADIRGIGISCAGPMDISMGTLNDPTNLKGPDGTSWGVVPIVQYLRSFFTGLPVSLENDAASAILGETWCGAAVGCDDVVMLTLGTGLGFAAQVAGKLVRAGRNLHTEGGHIILNWMDDGRVKCGCGTRGCAESYLAAPKFAQRFNFGKNVIYRAT